MQESASRWSRPALFVSLALILAVLAGCGTAGSPEEDQQPQRGQPQGEQTAEQDEGAPAERTGRDGDATGATQEEQAAGETVGPGAGEEVAEVRDGVWQVGDAGEVEFRFEDGALSFVDARPGSGWNVEIDDQSADEIEVDFRRGDTEWRFEVEAEGNVLEIERERRVDNDEAGTVTLGEAGELEYRREDDELVLIETRPQAGWEADVSEEDADEIEVDFTRGNVLWEYEAELDDGELETHLRERITGPVEG